MIVKPGVGLVSVLAVASLVLAAAPAAPAGVTTDELVIDSAALGGASTAQVLLPEDAGSRAVPVVYWLHDAVTPGSATVAEASAAMGLESLAAAGIAVVIVDLEGACGTCLWVDGHDGGGVDGETFLLDELVPAVEDAHAVRTDRGGRAVAGVGMGGTGAVIQGLRHPDVFGAVVGLDPTLDLLDPARSAVAHAYLATQGFPPLAAAEVRYRNLSPVDLASQAVAANQELVIAARDDRLDGASGILTTLGVPHTYLPGSTDLAQVVADEVAPRLTPAMAGPREDPWRFSIKTTDTGFGAWGWRFQVTRTNAEFLHVAGARLDGRDVILAGTGTVTVTTPATFEPDRSYVVRTIRDSLPEDPGNDGDRVNPPVPVYTDVIADGDGRLTVTVELFATRQLDEVQALRDGGQFPFHHVRVEVFDDLDAAAFGAWPTIAGEPVRPPHRTLSSLPAPYTEWNVSLATDTRAASNPDTSPQVLELQWDSPAIGRRVSARVWVPDAYVRSIEPFPVLYFLHGTGGGNQVDKEAFHTLLDRMRFVAVAPDAGTTPGYCPNCYWIDRHIPTGGLDSGTPLLPELERDFGEGRVATDAQTTVLEELLPLVEHLFEVRTDRGGRGVSGNSMGGLGASNMAFRHPDLFTVMHGLSGVLDLSEAEADAIYTQWWGYLAFQGYPFRDQVPVLYRELSPAQHASEMATANIETLWSFGDPCDDTLDDRRYCTQVWNVTAGSYFNHWVNEGYGRPHHDLIVPRIVDAGLPFTHPEFTGGHYSPDGEMFAKWMLPRINETFATPPPEPDRFSYKSVERRFAIWGYDVAVERPNLEFLHLLGARRDGRDVTVAGTGTLDLTLPAAFDPGATYEVRITPDGQATALRSVTADAAGRLHLEDLDLGPTRTDHERIELVEHGLFDIPHTRIRTAEAT